MTFNHLPPHAYKFQRIDWVLIAGLLLFAGFVVWCAWVIS